MEAPDIRSTARRNGYGQFCPVAVAAEVLAEKWNLLLVREMLCGSHRFNDIHRGVPLMSASLLSQRLRSLEEWGVLERSQLPGTRGHSYCLTAAGRALKPIIDGIGMWGLTYMRNTFAEENLDPSLLMWDMRRWIKPEMFPEDRTVIMINLIDVKKRPRTYWFVKDTREEILDLCLEDPGYDIDLTISADIGTLARVWLGDIPLEAALRDGRIEFEGSAALRKTVYDWIGLSPFASMRDNREPLATASVTRD